ASRSPRRRRRPEDRTPRPGFAWGRSPILGGFAVEGKRPLRRFGQVPGRDDADELGAGADAELGEDAAQGVVDRARADDQLGSRLAVGGPLAHRARDLQLLPRQPIDGARIAPARGLTGGAELAARPLGPERRAQPLELFQRRPERLARLDPASLPPQVLA